MATMERTMTLPLAPSPQNATWCLLLLEHLDEFATLAWYLVADGDLVEATFLRAMARLDVTPFDASTPLLVYNQARTILISEAIAVLTETRKEEEEENRAFEPACVGELPDLPRLAFMLRFIIRSSETDVAKFLDVTPRRVRELVRHAIDHLSTSVCFSPLAVCYEA